MRLEDLGIGRLFERIRDASIVADTKTQRVVFWNPAAIRIFGYSYPEALGLRVEALVPERLRAQHRAGMAHYAKLALAQMTVREARRVIEGLCSGPHVMLSRSASPRGILEATATTMLRRRKLVRLCLFPTISSKGTFSREVEDENFPFSVK